jgi:hypothetical protein
MTKCDTIQASHNKPLDQELAASRDILQQWGLQHIRIYPTSARGGFSNNEVLTLMKNYVR